MEIGKITWYNKKFNEYRVEFEDGTDDYINLDDALRGRNHLIRPIGLRYFLDIYLFNQLLCMYEKEIISIHFLFSILFLQLTDSLC